MNTSVNLTKKYTFSIQEGFVFELLYDNYMNSTRYSTLLKRKEYTTYAYTCIVNAKYDSL